MLTWNANNVSPKVTKAHIPTAYKTASASKYTQTDPSMKPSAAKLKKIISNEQC